MWLELLESSEGLDQLGDRRWRAAVVVLAAAGFVAWRQEARVVDISLLNLSSSFLCPCGYYENYVVRSMICMQILCTKSVLYGNY